MSLTDAAGRAFDHFEVIGVDLDGEVDGGVVAQILEPNCADTNLRTKGAP